MAGGLWGGNTSQYDLQDDGRMTKPSGQSKPPFRIPSMAEINAIPWNGMTVVSTFSGTGGSCLGYRMAGFKVAWANEFVPEAQRSYKANAAPDSIMDGRDIKLVTAAEILEAIGLAPGDLDIFDGSPPCQAFSTAGSREKGWGKDKAYAHGARQKNETLFDEYIRLLRGLRPKVFIAENVSGLVKGTAKGFFLEILAELKASGYTVAAKLLDAQWLGVPQARQRIIFVGVRTDLGRPPVFPRPLPYRYSVRDALPWIGRIEGANGFNLYAMRKGDQPMATVQAGRTLAIEELPEPESDISRFAIGAEWDKMGRPGTQSDKFFQLVRPALDDPCPTITSSGGCSSLASVTHPTDRRKFTIAELRPICGFPDDFVLTGSYAEQWARLGNSVPPLMMRAIAETVRDGVLIPTGAAGLPRDGS